VEGKNKTLAAGGGWRGIDSGMNADDEGGVFRGAAVRWEPLQMSVGHRSGKTSDAPSLPALADCSADPAYF
jgi:hypothetical protein